MFTVVVNDLEIYNILIRYIINLLLLEEDGHHHYHHHHNKSPSYSKEKDLADLFEIALTALAFLSFGMFIINVVMCISMAVSIAEDLYNYKFKMFSCQTDKYDDYTNDIDANEYESYR